jgi:glycine cleavage system transcriptional repressor
MRRVTNGTLHAITVIGHDRPGIIADCTRLIAELGLNLEDSTMTLLRGHFAMMLMCGGPTGESELRQALAPLSADGSLDVSVREVPVQHGASAVGASYVLTVHGGDRPGIVSSVAEQVAAVGGNITDLTTRLAGDLYLLVAEVDLPASTDVTILRDALAAAAKSLGVEVTLREVESDEL